MSELLQAAKAVISAWDDQYRSIDMRLKNLRAAVERAEKPPAYFMEWWETFPLKTDDVVPAVHAWEAGFTAAQQAERERIKGIIKSICIQDYESGEWHSCGEAILETIDVTTE